jgi:DNA-binding HxlR family transcriptional regulator
MAVTTPDQRAALDDLLLESSSAQAFQLLGKRWTGLVLTLLLQRPARFNELLRAVPGLSDRLLTERLRELTEAGVVERRVDPGPPTTITYAVTELGEAARPIVEAIRTWGRELTPPAGGIDCCT